MTPKFMCWLGWHCWKIEMEMSQIKAALKGWVMVPGYRRHFCRYCGVNFR